MMFPFDLLHQFAAEHHISLPDGIEQQLQIYADFLLDYNQHVNLTAITDPTEVVIKHFIDSISLLAVLDPVGSLLDVGTGAGFPGMPLLLAKPDLKVSLLDSMRKRLDFLSSLSEKLQVAPVLIHRRAEDAGRDKTLREQFNTVTARAVAPLNLLVEYCLPLTKVNGVMAAMKGPSAEQEVEQAKNAIRTLGGELMDCSELILPDGSHRFIIVIKKYRRLRQFIPVIPQKSPNLRCKMLYICRSIV